ncbi:hypothetical protein AMS60_18690 [Bacillus sp. FJAT-21945]|nr:hypothetical protein AMS60_18690 [Bacillus sp. FJAT-21945]
MKKMQIFRLIVSLFSMIFLLSLSLFIISSAYNSFFEPSTYISFIIMIVVGLFLNYSKLLQEFLARYSLIPTIIRGFVFLLIIILMNLGGNISNLTVFLMLLSFETISYIVKKNKNTKFSKKS